MKLLAVIVGLCAAASLATGGWLWMRTRLFVNGGDYAMDHDAAGDGTGGGIYAPAFLLMALGAFLARFAYKLWRA